MSNTLTALSSSLNNFITKISNVKLSISQNIDDLSFKKLEDQYKTSLQTKLELFDKLSKLKDQRSKVLNDSIDTMLSNVQYLKMALDNTDKACYNKLSKQHNNISTSLFKGIEMSDTKPKYTLENIFQAIKNPIVIYDINNTVVEYNEKYKKLCNFGDNIKNKKLEFGLFNQKTHIETPVANNMDVVNINGKIVTYVSKSLYYRDMDKYLVQTSVLYDTDNDPIYFMKVFTDLKGI